MFSTIFNVVLGVAAVYFFYQHNYIVGVLLMMATMGRLFQHKLQLFARALGQIAKYSDLEKNSNCFLQLTIRLEEVIKHESVRGLFRKLQSTGTITSEIHEDDWSKQLLQNYQQEYKTDNTSDEVKFNIKNNLLWKNGQIDFSDSIYHELFIPYDDPSGSRKLVLPAGDDFERKLETSFEAKGVHAGLSIRVFLVNGILKLQIGPFSKRLSPEVIEMGLDVYRTYVTITSFPLLYFSYQHSIPERYLNLSAYATDSWERHLKGEKTDLTKDWKEVIKDVADYNYVCSVANEYVEDKGRCKKIIKHFEAKRAQLLKCEGFVDPLARGDKEDHYYGPRENSVYYANKYLTVFVTDYNDLREHRKKYSYTDYYEETL